MDKTMTNAEKREETMRQRHAKQEENNRRLQESLKSQEHFIENMKISHQASMDLLK